MIARTRPSRSHKVRSNGTLTAELSEIKSDLNSNLHDLSENGVRAAQAAAHAATEAAARVAAGGREMARKAAVNAEKVIVKRPLASVAAAAGAGAVLALGLVFVGRRIF